MLKRKEPPIEPALQGGESIISNLPWLYENFGKVAIKNFEKPLPPYPIDPDDDKRKKGGKKCIVGRGFAMIKPPIGIITFYPFSGSPEYLTPGPGPTSPSFDPFDGPHTNFGPMWPIDPLALYGGKSEYIAELRTWEFSPPVIPAPLYHDPIDIYPILSPTPILRSIT